MNHYIGLGNADSGAMDRRLGRAFHEFFAQGDLDWATSLQAFDHIFRDEITGAAKIPTPTFPDRCAQWLSGEDFSIPAMPKSAEAVICRVRQLLLTRGEREIGLALEALQKFRRFQNQLGGWEVVDKPQSTPIYKLSVDSHGKSPGLEEALTFLGDHPDKANIKALDISGSDIADLTALGKFQHLELLIARNCPRLNDLSTLREACPMLRQADFTKSAVERGLEGIFTLPYLQRASFSGTKISELPKIERSNGNLQNLSLSGTQITMVGPLAQLVGLQVLSLRKTGVQNLVGLERCLQLQELSLLGCLQLTDCSSLEQIANLRKILIERNRRFLIPESKIPLCN